MNETIRRILAESGTKTSKIRKLLLIGLSHREIADLLTRGNRGFVWNVYKRMRDEGLLPASQTATVLRPEPDYTFNRCFGVEIEAYNCPRQTLTDALREAGIPVEIGSRNAETNSNWKLTTDGSLEGSHTLSWSARSSAVSRVWRYWRGYAGCWTHTM